METMVFEVSAVPKPLERSRLPQERQRPLFVRCEDCGVLVVVKAMLVGKVLCKNCGG